MLNTKLTICIATYNRGDYIAKTLDSILGQLPPNVELVVVDGASPDNTPDVMAEYVEQYPELRYIREQENSGIDRDYDKAVEYATGEYCWLMTDDDLMRPGAIDKVLSAISDCADVIVVDAEVRNANLKVILERSRLKLDADRVYKKGQHEEFFIDAADHLSFIGCVIIRRDLWLKRDRESYYGTVFIHVGVIFQNPPIEDFRVISEPLIVIRYGNAMWSSRAFVIWMFKWPKLIWGFSDYSDKAKKIVCDNSPLKIIKSVFTYRAKGVYSISEFNDYYSRDMEGLLKYILYFIAIFPVSLANILLMIYALKGKSSRMAIYDLSLSKNVSMLSRFISNRFVK